MNRIENALFLARAMARPSSSRAKLLSTDFQGKRSDKPTTPGRERAASIWVRRFRSSAEPDTCWSTQVPQTALDRGVGVAARAGVLPRAERLASTRAVVVPRRLARDQ